MEDFLLIVNAGGLVAVVLSFTWGASKLNTTLTHLATTVKELNNSVKKLDGNVYSLDTRVSILEDRNTRIQEGGNVS